MNSAARTSAAAPAPARAAEFWRALLLGALVIGLLLVALPPRGLWPAACLLPWPFVLLAREAKSGARAFLRGWLVGVPYVALGTAWLAETSVFNLAVVALVAALYLGLLAWALRAVLASSAVWPALPLLWVAQELLRLNWPLNGYPWLFLGHAVAASPVFVQVADLGGVLAVSFVAASVAAGILALRDGRRAAARGAALTVLAAAAYGLLRPGTLPEPQPGPLLGTIQPAFPQRLKDNPVTADERFLDCLALSRELLDVGGEGGFAPGERADGVGAAREPLDLLIWPETSWPYPLGEGNPQDIWFPAGAGHAAFTAGDAARLADERLRPLLRQGRAGRHAAPLLLGAVWRWTTPAGRVAMANSAVLLDPEGTHLGRADKRILVPGGETVPFKNWLPRSGQRVVEQWIVAFAGWVADLEPGPGDQRLALGDTPFGVTICYENAYGAASRRLVQQGAAFLVNLSNEAWFGTTSEFDQMELQSVLRTVETRRALFRSTNSGVSCLVLPTGRPPSGADKLEIDGVDRAVAGSFAARVPLYTGTTLYVRLGDWPGWIGAGCALVLLLRARRRAAGASAGRRAALRPGPERLP